jgi:CheY-like chemotaxis protein
MADDDSDDRSLVEAALEKVCMKCRFYQVADGRELMDYLYRRGGYGEPRSSPRPDLILLDINMPRMDGYEALRAIRNEGEFRLIPIVVLTTSREEPAITKAYELGANAVVIKPYTFEDFSKVVRVLQEFWTEVAARPAKRE